MPRLAVAVGAVLLGAGLLAQDPAEDSILPVGTDGSPLNLDFEAGSLKDWKATGTAFEKQPVKGDAVASRRQDMKSEHVGEWWIGTYEGGGDAPTGTLSSAPFRITHPFASFRVAGGSHESTRVELVLVEGDKVFLKVSGEDSENLKPVIADLGPMLGKSMYLRLVDENSMGWGHINFDHFRFHAKRPRMPNVRNQNSALARDTFKNSGLGPEEAAKAFSLPEGFRCVLGAGEPEVSQPIAMAFDERGRLWIAENPDYPAWKAPEAGGKCRVLIFEDQDGDGRLETRKVFVEGINFISGLEVGFGGAWIGAPPFLLFVPDKDGDDVPDGPGVPVLDGWEHQDTHETLNAFIWGPDGWLYGCHGVFTYSSVGKPGDPPEKRQQINAGYWRYHPRQAKFELFAEGCSNQWGIDFNDHGQAFATACVIPHLYHVIQGARYQRQSGAHFNPYTYEDLRTIADHVHYAGTRGPHAGNGLSDAAGGGHAHCGAMCYLGGSFPDEYRNRLFFNNIHGARINMDILEPKGSGYVGRHGADFAMANDRWSQILNLRYGPDGAAWIIDWYDKQQCHTVRAADHDRSNGRIFKVQYQSPPVPKVDLRKLSVQDLVKLTLHKNDWYVRHARKVLQERDAKEAAPALQSLLTHPDPTRVLRAMWALHVLGSLDAMPLLSHADPHVRAWAIQLSLEDGVAEPTLQERMGELAVQDPSPVVRLYLASALQRMPLDQRLPILQGLVAHAEDAEDHNLALMYWYAMEPLAASDAKAGASLLGKNRIPKLRTFISRRMTAGK